MIPYLGIDDVPSFKKSGRGLEGFNEFVWSMKFLIRPNALSE